MRSSAHWDSVSTVAGAVAFSAAAGTGAKRQASAAISVAAHGTCRWTSLSWVAGREPTQRP
ncbi:hypothetical protein MRO55_24790, partial [Escherichia coli]|uniref:hypothetical protein n=1 Tax=Escherichia coli TaxID=562 RepID=UPI002114D4C9